MKRQLQFIYIGKCGGSKIEKILPISAVVKDKYSSCFETHVSGVVVDSNCDYLFCVRNPIDRAFRLLSGVRGSFLKIHCQIKSDDFLEKEKFFANT